jgi:hypothetical protein
MSVPEAHFRAMAADTADRALDHWLAACSVKRRDAEPGLDADFWHDLCVLLAEVRDERRRLAEAVEAALCLTVDLGQVEDDPGGAA